MSLTDAEIQLILDCEQDGHLRSTHEGLSDHCWCGRVCYHEKGDRNMSEMVMGPAEQILPPWLYEHYRAARATGVGQYRYGTKSLDEVMRTACQYIGNDSAVIDYQPGNGTRYLIVLARTPDGPMVALPHFNAVGFVGRGYVTPEYVAEKLGLKPVDAEVVAEFLTLLSYANGYE